MSYWLLFELGLLKTIVLYCFRKLLSLFKRLHFDLFQNIPLFSGR